MVACEAFAHLLPALQPLAALPDAQRMRHLHADRWIGYPRARAILATLDSLLTHPRRQRMPNVLLLGPTNNGKSMLVEKFRRDHPPGSASPGDPVPLPVLVVQMPSGPDIKRFYSLLLHRMGIPSTTNPSLARLEDHALDMLETLAVRVLVIDEVHNLVAGPAGRMREVLHLLRFVGNELKIALVCVGIKDAYLAIRSDAQLENRFEPCTLPRWVDDDATASLLASFEAVLPLRKPSQLAAPRLAATILARTEGTIGEMSTLLTRAAVVAIETGRECIDQTVLEAVDYHSPTERRRRFERAAV
jgi:TniB protein